MCLLLYSCVCNLEAPARRRASALVAPRTHCSGTTRCCTDRARASRPQNAMNLASLSRGAACPCQLTRGGASGPRQAAPPSLCVHRSAVRGRQLQWARRWLPRSLRSDNRAVCSSSGTPAGENWIQKNKRSATLCVPRFTSHHRVCALAAPRCTFVFCCKMRDFSSRS